MMSGRSLVPKNFLVYCLDFLYQPPSRNWLPCHFWTSMKATRFWPGFRTKYKTYFSATQETYHAVECNKGSD